MGRGPGAVTLAALPRARAWYSDRGSAVPEEKVVRGSRCGGSWKRRGRGHLASRGQRAGRPRLPARGRAQTHARAAGAFRGAFLSLRSAAGSRRVRSLPEARAGAQGSPLTAAVGVGVGGRGGGEWAVSPPAATPPPVFFFSARCHLFAAGHVSVVACQALWLGFGGPGWDPRGGAGGGERGDLGV